MYGTELYYSGLDWIEILWIFGQSPLDSCVRKCVTDYNTVMLYIVHVRVFGGVPWVGKGEYSIMKMAMAAR